MTYKELLDSVSFDEIVPFIERYHGWNALAWYKVHYDYLRHLTPEQGEITTATVSNGEPDESWPEPHLDSFPLEGDLWEHSLAKELIIEPDVKASLAEIAMCCLWHTSFYGFTEEDVRIGGTGTLIRRRLTLFLNRPSRLSARLCYFD